MLYEVITGMGVQFEDGLPDEAFKTLIEFAIASGMLSRSVAEVAGQSDTRNNFV